MTRTTLLRTILGASLVAMLYAAPAHAQSTRTWVSGVGDDANPCSRTAPCKTFATAFTRTAAGGEINCIDPGGFGAVTINKNITIACEYTEGGILAALVNGVNINAAGIFVVLRGLDIEGAGNGLIGVNITNAARVHIEKCIIHGFRGGTAAGIVVNTAAGINTRVIVDNTYITDNGNGITLTAAGTAQLTGEKVIVAANSFNGVSVTANTVATFRNSVFAYNGLSGVQVSSGNGTINVYTSTVQNNGTAVNVASSTGRVRIADNNIHNNATAYTIAPGGLVESAGNNRVGDNGAGAPNAVITNQ
jgi:parallel beta helix pectate lyase-like protein